MITIPKDKLNDLIRHVYDMSQPVGLGILHFTPKPLSDEEIASMIHPEGRQAVRMDYVNGRQCKMSVFRKEDGDYEIYDTWYDHSPEQLDELLEKLGVEK